MGIEINKIGNINNAGNAGLKSSEASSSADVSIMSVKTDDIELLKKLGITKEEFKLLTLKYPDIDIKTLHYDKQLQLVADYRAEVKQAAVQKTEAENVTDTQNQLETVNNQTKSEKFNKTEYNNFSLDKKVDACFAEFAKNQYIYGTKHDGKVISEPHSQEEWDALTSEEKNNMIEITKSVINNDKKLSNLKQLIPSEGGEEEKLAIADGVMRSIQAANMEGVSYLEFLHKDEYDRTDIVESYLKISDPKELNDNDKKYMDHLQLLSTAVKDAAAANKNGNINKIECDQDVREYIKRNNLNEDELMYNALQSKVDKGIKLSDDEQKQYDELKKFMETDAGQLQIQKAKAANLTKIQAQFDELQAKINNGEELNARDQGLYNDLKNTLNSEESKKLKELAAIMPKPQTEREKQIVNDLEVFQEEIKDHVKGAGSEAVAAFAYLENKCKDMSDAEKKEYLKTALKFYNGPAAANLFKAYADKFDLWNDEYLTDKAAVNIGKASEENMDKFSKTAKSNFNSDDEYRKKIGRSGVKSANQVLVRSEYKVPEKDANKKSLAKLTAEIGTEDDLKLSTSVNATITNEDDQIEAQEYTYSSKNATDEVFIDATNKAKLFKVKAQIPVLKGAMERSPKATANVAENDIIASLAKENQTEAFSYTHEMIDKQFKKDDAIRYSNALADQIQKCHKDNQLDMHNDIMKSKYSEVQEHAASNINKLDPTVQNDALDSVIRTGNKEAINSAMNSMEKCSPDVQKIQIVNMAAQNAFENAGVEEKAKLLNSTSLTPEQFAKLTPSEKKDYYKRIFDKASPGEKIQMLSKLPGSQQKTVYTLICRFFPEVLSTMLKDSTMAEKMLNSGMPVDAINKVITILQASEDLSIIKLLGEMEDNPLYKSYFADREHKETKKVDEQQSGGIDFIRNTFATSPKDLAINNKKIKSNMDLRV